MFGAVKEFFSYKWGGKFFASLKLSKNTIEVPSEVVRYIRNGFIFGIAYFILACLSGILFIIGYLQVLGVENWLTALSAIGSAALTFGAVLFGVISLAISAVLVYVTYVYLTGRGVRNAKRYYVFFWLSLIGLVIDLVISSFTFFYALAWLAVDPILALAMIASMLVYPMSMVNIAVGCVGFCKAANE